MLRDSLQEEFLRLITGYKSSGQQGVNSVLNIQPCYIGLLTDLQVNVSGGVVSYTATEPTDPAYERVLIGKTATGGSGTIQVYEVFPTSPDYTTDEGGNAIAVLQNISQILFPAAEEAYTSTIKYIGFYTNDGWIRDAKGKKVQRTDDSSSGLKLFAKLDEPKSIAKDTIPMFRVDALKISTN